MVHEPTRDQYLLDLYLSDIPGTLIEVGPKIADHKMLLAKIPVPKSETLSIKRKRFNTSRADWKGLNKELTSTDWMFLKEGTAEEASKQFMEKLWIILCSFIPYEEVDFKKRSHPWLNSKCEEAIQNKNAAEGSELFAEKQKKCATIISEEFQKYQ